MPIHLDQKIPDAALTLFAALNYLEGKLTGRIAARHRAVATPEPTR